MSKNYVGYVRVSTKEQNERRQLDALSKQGVTSSNIYIDKISGKNFERPAYQEMLTKLNNQSVLFIMSIDRLGRNYKEICEQWSVLTKQIGADVVVIDMPLLDTRREKDLLGTFISDLTLTLLSYCAESEYRNIRSRQAAGIAAARARGVNLGRPARPLPDKFGEICKKWEMGLITMKEAARLLDMPVSSFRYRALKWDKEGV